MVVNIRETNKRVGKVIQKDSNTQVLECVKRRAWNVNIAGTVVSYINIAK